MGAEIMLALALITRQATVRDPKFCRSQLTMLRYRTVKLETGANLLRWCVPGTGTLKTLQRM